MKVRSVFLKKVMIAHVWCHHMFVLVQVNSSITWPKKTGMNKPSLVHLSAFVFNLCSPPNHAPMLEFLGGTEEGSMGADMVSGVGGGALEPLRWQIHLCMRLCGPRWSSLQRKPKTKRCIFFVICSGACCCRRKILWSSLPRANNRLTVLCPRPLRHHWGFVCRLTLCNACYYDGCTCAYQV